MLQNQHARRSTSYALPTRLQHAVVMTAVIMNASLKVCKGCATQAAAYITSHCQSESDEDEDDVEDCEDDDDDDDEEAAEVDGLVAPLPSRSSAASSATRRLADFASGGLMVAPICRHNAVANGRLRVSETKHCWCVQTLPW